MAALLPSSRTAPGYGKAIELALELHGCEAKPARAKGRRGRQRSCSSVRSGAPASSGRREAGHSDPLPCRSWVAEGAWWRGQAHALACRGSVRAERRRRARRWRQWRGGRTVPLLLLLVRREGQNGASGEAKRGTACFGEQGASAGATGTPGAGWSRTLAATRRPASAAVGHGLREREAGCRRERRQARPVAAMGRKWGASPLKRKLAFLFIFQIQN
jgi:hypothetical protein